MEAESVGVRTNPPLLLKWCLLSAILPAAAGCNDLGFEKETVVLAFPPGRDELRVLFVYEGFHVTRDGKSDLKNAQKELGELMASEHEFRLGDWPWIFNLEHKKDESAETKAFLDFLGKHATIRKGAFFHREGGVLNGYQTLVIRDARKFISGANDAVSAQLAKSLPDTLAKHKEEDFFDRTSLELILQAAREKQQWVKLDPGRVSCTLPGTHILFERCKREVLQIPRMAGLDKEVALDEIDGMKRTAAWLSKLPLSFDQRKDKITISLGFGDGEPIYLKMPENTGLPTRRDKELIAHARTLKVPFRELDDVPSLVAEFLKEAQKAK